MYWSDAACGVLAGYRLPAVPGEGSVTLLAWFDADAVSGYYRQVQLIQINSCNNNKERCIC